MLDPDEPLLNIKDETLEHGTYQQQQADLVDLLTELTKDTTMNTAVKRVAFRQVESYTITRKELSGGVPSISEFFDPNNDSVLTIYYLNDEENRRHFKTVDEFVTLRDRILNEVGSCMSARQN
ncbi:MAG TPA: hypothetical protein VGC88_08990 [Terriglobales bacterium]